MEAIAALAQNLGIDIVSVGGMAGAVILLMGFIKKFAPKVQGDIALYFTGGLCLLFSAASYYPNILAIIVAGVLMFASAVGAYEFKKSKTGGNDNA